MYSWALKIRLENKDRHGPMDNLEGTPDWPGYDPLTHGQEGYWDQGSWGGGYPAYGGDAAAIGKGKGKFRGDLTKGWARVLKAIVGIAVAKATVQAIVKKVKEKEVSLEVSLELRGVSVDSATKEVKRVKEKAVCMKCNTQIMGKGHGPLRPMLDGT